MCTVCPHLGTAYTDVKLLWSDWVSQSSASMPHSGPNFIDQAARAPMDVTRLQMVTYPQ
jgi:hypothetical protein